MNKYDFDMDLRAGRHVVDAKSVLGIFSLDLSRVITLEIEDGDSIPEEQLAALLEESRAQLDELEYADDRLAKLEKEIAAARKTAQARAKDLTGAREIAARRLEKQVEQELRDLSMPSVRFLVERAETKELTASGAPHSSQGLYPARSACARVTEGVVGRT